MRKRGTALRTLWRPLNLFESPPFWMYIIGFLLLLGPLVTVHELGHYLVGRWFGVKAEAFSIGFGKEMAGWTDKQGTRWKLSWIPLGGYVQFKGDMNPASIPDPDAPIDPALNDGSFQSAALWKRALIVAAGPVTNLVVAIAIFAAFFAILGNPRLEANTDLRIVTEFDTESAARDAGVKIGDKIVAIDGEPVASFEEIVEQVMLFPDERLLFSIERSGDVIEIPIETARVEIEDSFGNVSVLGRIGIKRNDGYYVFEDVSVLQAVPLAVEKCWDITKMMVTGIKQIITGQRSIKELGGPLKIAKFSGEQLSLGFLSFVNLVALISLNLAFINILPIPALDGGHLAFYAVEAVRRKPAGPRMTEWAYRVGIFLVLAFMAVVITNDVTDVIWKPIFG